MSKFLFILFLSSLVMAQQEEESEGMRAMRLGCEKQKQGLGCVNYANMLIKKGQEDRAEKYFKKACDLNYQDGCEKKRWEEVKSEALPNPEEFKPEEAKLEEDLNISSEPEITTEIESVPVTSTVVPKIMTFGKDILNAASRGDLSAIQAALQNNLDVNAVEPQRGGGLLHIAAHHRQFGIFKFLVENGANINQVDKDQSAPIHFAAYKGDLQTLKYLIDKKVELSNVDNEGYTPLGYAKLAKSPEKIQALMDAGAK